MLVNVTQLKRKQKATIVDVSIRDERIKTRLKELGFVKGSMVWINKISPFKDPLDIEIQGSSVCLNKEIAKTILVETLP